MPRFDDGTGPNNGAVIPTRIMVRHGWQSGAGQQPQVVDNPESHLIEDPTQTNRSIRPVTPPDLIQFPRLLEMTKYSPRGY